MAHATQVRIFLQNLFPALIGTTATVSLFVDNQGAVALSKNKISQQRSKHIDVKYHFVQSHVESGNAQPIHVPFSMNVAGAFIKLLSGNKLENLIR